MSDECEHGIGRGWPCIQCNPARGVSNNEIERLKGELEAAGDDCNRYAIAINKLTTERDEAHEALRHVHWLMGERDVEKPIIPEWIINDVCNYITSKLPDTAPSQEAECGYCLSCRTVHSGSCSTIKALGDGE